MNGVNGTNGVVDGVNGTHTAAVKLWEHPDPKSSRMFEFMQMLNDKYNAKVDSYRELHKWSIDNLAAFWGEVWDYTGIVASRPYRLVRMRLHS